MKKLYLAASYEAAYKHVNAVKKEISKYDCTFDMNPKGRPYYSSKLSSSDLMIVLPKDFINHHNYRGDGKCFAIGKGLYNEINKWNAENKKPPFIITDILSSGQIVGAYYHEHRLFFCEQQTYNHWGFVFTVKQATYINTFFDINDIPPVRMNDYAHDYQSEEYEEEEDKPPFNRGDIVIMSNNYYGISEGTIGTVTRMTNNWKKVGVQFNFDVPFGGGDRDCHGSGEPGKCAYIPLEYVKLHYLEEKARLIAKAVEEEAKAVNIANGIKVHLAYIKRLNN